MDFCANYHNQVVYSCFRLQVFLFSNREVQGAVIPVDMNLFIMTHSESWRSRNSKQRLAKKWGEGGLHLRFLFCKRLHSIIFICYQLVVERIVS